MNNLYGVIKGFVETEKTYKLQAIGKYVFLIDPKATKIDVKNAVKLLYGVTPISVNTTRIRKKQRMLGRNKIFTKRSAGIKAVVTLKKGEKIDFNSFKTPSPKAKKVEVKKEVKEEVKKEKAEKKTTKKETVKKETKVDNG